jgi:cytochrome c-type biogenesis protein CcmH
MYGRRRSRSAAAEEQSSFQLTADEQARLDRLIAVEPAPDKPV